MRFLDELGFNLSTQIFLVNYLDSLCKGHRKGHRKKM